MRRLLCLLLGAALLLGLCGCGREKETAAVTLWYAEDDPLAAGLLRGRADLAAFEPLDGETAELAVSREEAEEAAGSLPREPSRSSRASPRSRRSTTNSKP